MKQFYGASQTGKLQEAVSSLRNPQFIVLMSNKNQFEQHVEELEKLYPNVPSIGCIGMSYDTKVVKEGVAVVAYLDGVSAVANVLEQTSVMPVKYIQRLEQDVRKIGANSSNTVCIDFCSNNDACVLTTIYSVLGKQNISLVGGTGDAGKVSANGKVYQDAAAYALIKNQGGKVKVYKENMYKPLLNYRFIASNTDKSRYIIGQLNGKSAKKVYQEILKIKESDITTQTFQNPFGKIVGKDVCIISIKEVVGDALACFRQVNDSDVLTLLELQDYKKVAAETMDKIKSEFGHISGVFSVNCLFRYRLFEQNKNMTEYLQDMSKLGNHVGMVGYGEHYNNQFVNQSMTCVVFE